MHDHAHHHHHGHDHDHHDHGHSHRHDLSELGQRRLLIVLALTAVFMVVEFIGGWLSNSLALMADAAHMLSDVAALGLSIFALWFARRPATAAKTYGYMRAEILAALVNGAALVAIAVVILWQAYVRLRAPEAVEGGLMLVVAIIGFLVNVVAAVLLHGSSGHSLNVRGAYLHVLGDLLGSAGAILAALIILATGWLAADPVISAFVAVLILFGSWRLVKESVDVLLEATPTHIDLRAVRAAIARIEGVEDVFDLHVWTVTSGFIAMSGHVTIADLKDYSRILESIHTAMHTDFRIEHVTVQIEHRALYQIQPGPRLPE